MKIVDNIKEDFDNWLRDPLYHGGIVEDIIISLLAIVGLVIVVILAKT